jgi:hypothetical protein
MSSCRSARDEEADIPESSKRPEPGEAEADIDDFEACSVLNSISGFLMLEESIYALLIIV